MIPSKQSQSQLGPILYFSRGRGRGHAIPDMAILDEWRRLRPKHDVCFASYATGAATLAQQGYPLIDLRLPEDPQFIDTVVRAGQIIQATKPAVVISHEEFGALPAAKLFGCPTIFIVDFLPPVDPWRDSLRYADQIVFIERRGLFGEPPSLCGKIRYVGPVVRPMCVGRADARACRQELGLPANGKVISVIPGAWATEKRAPIFDLVVEAFQALREKDKRLVWVTGRDHEELSARLRGIDGAIAIRDSAPVEKLMVASDVGITKGNRGTTIDLACLGVPSIALSFALNPIDEVIVGRIKSNQTLTATGIDAHFLAESIEEILEQDSSAFEPSKEYRVGGAAAVARELVSLVEASRWDLANTEGALRQSGSA